MNQESKPTNPVKDLLAALEQFGGSTWVSVSDGDRRRAPGNFADAVQQLVAENKKLREANPIEVTERMARIVLAKYFRTNYHHSDMQVADMREALEDGIKLCSAVATPPSEKVVTLTEKNIERAAEAKYCEFAIPDCDPPWCDADALCKAQLRESVKKTARELFHGSGMRLEIVP